MSISLSKSHRRAAKRARLLNEFLVSLAILFLALGANFAVLHSASNSSERSALEARALELAREGIEEVVVDPKPALNRPLSASFGAGKGEAFDATFSRKSWVKMIKTEKGLIGRATVEVTWDKGQKLRLERYVRTD